jgi:thiol-disulfide isomerase/thioredoxin
VSYRRTIVAGALSVALLFAALHAIFAETIAEMGAGPERDTRPVAGFRAPSVTGIDVLTGEQVSLSDLRGKPVLLNFWATWCPPCKEEMPDLARVSRDLAGIAHVLAVGDGSEAPAMLQDFLAAERIEGLTVLHDAGDAAGAYRVRSLPTTYFVDADGIIRAGGPMVLTYSVARMQLERMTRGLPPE